MIKKELSDIKKDMTSNRKSAVMKEKDEDILSDSPASSNGSDRVISPQFSDKTKFRNTSRGRTMDSQKIKQTKRNEGHFKSIELNGKELRSLEKIIKNNFTSMNSLKKNLIEK